MKKGYNLCLQTILILVRNNIHRRRKGTNWNKIILSYWSGSEEENGCSLFHCSCSKICHSIIPADYGAPSKPLFTSLNDLNIYFVFSLSKQVLSCIHIMFFTPFPRAYQTSSQFHQHSTRYSDCNRPHTCQTNIKKLSILLLAD